MDRTDSPRAGKRGTSSWRPPGASARTTAIAIAFNVVPALLALTGLILFTPASPDFDPVIAISLVVISALAYLAEARLKHDALVFFGSEFAIVLVAVATQGPFVALAVWLVPDVIGRFVLRRQPRWSPGFVATISSYVLAILAASWLLQLAGDPSGAEMIPALYAAGVAMAL